jgi:hypothetical protein
MLHMEDADRVLIGRFETNTIVADAKPEIGRALKTLHVFDTGIRVVRQRSKNL